MSEAQVKEHEREADEENSDGAAPHEEGEDQADVEARARSMGWRPLEEFKGDKKYWRDAAEYVKRGETILPIVQSQNHELRAALSKTNRQLEEANKKNDEINRRLDESGKVFAEFREFQKQISERAYARARRDLEAQRDAAVAEGSMENYKRVQTDIDALEKEHRAPEPRREETQPQQRQEQQPAPQAQQVDPYYREWLEDNRWFYDDPDAADLAKITETRIARDNPNMSTRDRLAEVRRRIAKAYPEHFGNPRREAPSSVSTPQGGNGRQPKKGKGYDDLPADAKKAGDRFVKQGLMSKDDYAKEYWSMEV